MSLRAVVIDDEPLAREGLELRLEALDQVEVDGSFGRARAAMDALRGDPPVVIFVTAYDEYAVQAFEERVVDYLLKPVDTDRLADAVEQARKQIRQRQFDELGPKLRGLLDTLDDPAKSEKRRGLSGADDVPPTPNRIAVRTRGRVIMVRPQEIDYVEGAGDYVELHVGDDTYLHRETMAGIEERLAPHGFQRIHRSTIVNLDRVRSLTTDAHGAYHVCLKNGPRLKLSRSYREAFEEAIGTSF